jgi:streptogramin lyase
MHRLWSRLLWSRLFSSSARKQRLIARNRKKSLLLETLEDRTAPAVFTDLGSSLHLDLGTNEKLNILSFGSAYAFDLGPTGTWSGTDTASVIGNGAPTLNVTGAGITAFSAGINITDTASGGGTAVNFGPSGLFAFANNFGINLTHSSSGASTPGLGFSGTTVFSGTAGLNASVNGDVIVNTGANYEGTGGALSLSATGVNAPLTVNGNVLNNNGAVTMRATGALTVGSGATINSGTGSLSLGADVKPDGTGDDGIGTLTIGAGANLYAANLTLRGADENIDPTAVVGSATAVAPTASTFVNSGLTSPNGLAFGPDGNLYVANGGTTTISKVTPAGVVSTFVNSGVNNPQGLAFDANGNLYVSNLGNNTISKVTPAGAVSTFVSSGLAAPQGLAFDPSGNLYVANGVNNTISKVTPAGVVSTFANSGLNSPDGLAFGPDGNLYVTNNNDGTISKVTPAGAVSTFANSGLGAGIGSPVFDPNGNLYFVTGATGTIMKVTPAAVVSTFFNNNPKFPYALVLGADGNFYLANGDNTIGRVPLSEATLGIAATNAVTIQSSVESRSMSIGGTNGSAVAGINLTSAKLARIFTASSGTITVGDSSQTGNITFAGAVTATTPGANTVVLQSTSGAGGIIFDPSNGTALNGNGGRVSLTPGTGALSGTLSPTNALLASNGFTATGLTLNLALSGVPTHGQLSTLVHDTGTAISSNFTGLTAGSTTTIAFSGAPYSFGVSYTGGTGTDLVLTQTDPTVQFVNSSQTVQQNAGTFSVPVTLSAASPVSTTIPFTLGGTAVSGTDYSGVTASPLVIPAGQTTGTITGTVINTGATSNKTIVFTLGTPTNATLGSTTTDTLTIVGSQTITKVDAGTLEFQAPTGFSSSGSVYTSTNPVQVGFIPASGKPFVALLQLTGTTSIDTSALTFSSTGAVSAAIGGSPTVLVSGGLSNASIAALTGSGLTGVAGSAFALAGVTFTPSTLILNATGAAGQPEIQLQGSLALPNSIAVGVSGSNFVNIDSSGQHLVEVSATVTSPSFTVGGVAFGSLQLTATYSATNNQFTLTGNGNGTISNLGTFSVGFGNASTAGLVVTNGALTSLDVAVTSVLNVASVNFATNNLDLKYNASSSQYNLSGSTTASVTGLGALSVTFGHGTNPGLVVTNGALVSLDMTLNSNITAGAVTFSTTGLECTYTAASSQFALIGSTSASVTGLGTLNLAFGHGSKPGLVITNGALTSLDLTLNSNITAGAVTFSTTGLEFTYTASSNQFALTGSTSASVAKLGTLNLTFGHGTNPGLVITNGALTSLDLTLNSNITVGAVTFSTTGLEFAYTAASRQFALTGNTSASVTGLGTLNLTFGHGTKPGLVITSGTLTSLDLTLNSNITVAAVTFSTTGLEFTYTASSNQFALTGSTSANVAKLGTLNLAFGHGTNPGLVVTNGALVSLDLTLNSNITVGAVTFSTTGLEFTYTAVSSQFALTGSTSASVTGLGTLNLTFGHGTNPGLVITSGALTSLDLTLNSNITVAAVTFNTTGLEFTYTASSNQFTLAGNTTASVAKLGTLNLTFGHGTNPGLVVTNGALVSLDMTLNSNITVGAVAFSTTGLEFTYTASNSQFTLAGSAAVTVGGIGNFSVTFGHGTNPGLVITNGSLTSLDLTVNSNIHVGAVTFSTTGLEFTYTASSNQFTLTGNTSASVTGLGTLNLTFGHGTNPGLVVTNGALVSLDMTLNSNITAGAVAFSTTGLEFTYTAANSQYTLTGTATVTVSHIDNFSVMFGHGSNPGLVITNGSLTSLDLTVNSNIRVGGVTFGTTGLEFTYTAANSQYTLAGTATVTVGSINNFSVMFGHGTNPGLVITNGSLILLR